MIKVTCPNCGKKYAIKGTPRKPSIKCPKCSGTILLPEGAAATRSALRSELSRLAGQGAERPVASSLSSTSVRVVSPEEEELLSDRWRLLAVIGAIFLFCLIFGGGFFWLYWRTRSHVVARQPGDGGAVVENESDVSADTEVQGTGRTEAPTELPATVLAAWQLAQDADRPCDERTSLTNYKVARDALLPYAEIAPDKLKVAEERIEALTKIIKSRQEKLGELEKQLFDVREDIEAGKTNEARRALQKVQAALKALKCPGQLGEDLVAEAGRLQGQLRPPRQQPPTSAVVNSSTPPPAITDPAVKIIDKPRRIQRWRAEGWANGVSIKLQGDAAKDAQYITLTLMKGSKGKWVVSLPKRIDLTSYDRLLVDTRAKEAVDMALGVWVGSELYESRPERVPGDPEGKKWATVAFDIEGNGFKCEASNWQFRAKIGSPAEVDRISLFFYRRSTSPFDFCNVRLRPKE